MRSTPVKLNKKPMKASNKKALVYKNRRMADIKPPIRDTISETISFVIKGKLTPIKPILIENKLDLTKSNKKTTKCGKVVKKINQKPYRPNPKAIKKSDEENSKLKPVQIKTAKKSALTSCKKNVDKISVDLIPKPTKMKKSAKPVKINSSEKILKTKIDVKAKRGKIDKIRKPPVKKIRKQVRIGKSNIDCTVSSEQNEADELKKRQTIEQLLKEVNEEMKAKNSNKTKAAKDKVKVKPKRQAAPNKKLSHSNEVDNVSEKVLDEKIMDSIEKAIKTELIDSPGELSDEIPLNKLSVMKTTFMTPESIKVEPLSDKERSPPRTLKKKQYRKLKTKPKITVIKKRVISAKDKNKKEEQRCKTKLFRFWNGPKRHRVASLNALAKVHCLYENETRGNILDIIDESAKLAYAPKSDQVKPKTPKIKKESQDEDMEDAPSPLPTRTLRSVPGLRAIGKHWDMHDTSSSSEGEEDSSNSEHFPLKVVKREKPPKQKKVTAKVARVTPKEKPRKKNELTMDLKDMVVCKRMASLNASAILAASYSPERRASKSLRDFDDSSSISASSEEYFAASDDEIKEEDVKKEEDEAKLLEVNAPNKKVAVILNQDTDVTITGVYVNSTTRSTHHEGYCSIAGMQYRISATSHTQTAATAVATETLLQSSSSSAPDNSNSDSVPSKSYTPLDALSNMQPPPGPGIQHNHPVVHGQQHMGPPQHVLPMPAHQMSPGLHHSCSSAFSSPHSTPNYQIPPGHHPPIQAEPGYVHAGYYQPAGPLITVPHGHGGPPPPPPVPPQPTLTKTAPLSEASSVASTTPSVTSHDPPPPPPSSNGDSSDSEVIITSVTTAKDSIPPPTHPPSAYRYPQYPAAPHGYQYSYPPPYHYPNPPPNPSYAHHDLCYSPNPYVHKYSPYRSRYVTGTQYYPPPNPQDMYGAPSQPSQQVVTTTVSPSTSGYPPMAPPGPPPPTLMDTYPAPPQPSLVEYQPPPPHYYPPVPYGPAPSCYTHSPSRTVPYINATYQTCPCPMQSCPKNGLTGPLTGDSKRSNISSISKDSMPLPPVALALPLEPTSATGPPSPARGSAGMPPPPSASPAGATYQPPPPPTKQESHSPVVLEDCKIEKKKARLGKQMVRNNIAAMQNTMLLMCNPPQNIVSTVKREIESPKQKEIVEQKKEVCMSDEETKPVTENLPLPCTKIEEAEQEESKSLASIAPKEEKNHEKLGNADKNENTVIEVVEEILQPVVSTVAENVKVKNMKRTLSMSKEKVPDPEISPSPKKKQKLGSYKYLIKKESNTVRIHNGKRKLIEEQSLEPVQTRTKIDVEKPNTKRKLGGTKKAATKPLRLSKQQIKSNFRSKSKDKEPIIDVKEPLRNKVSKKPKVNSKCNSKSAPAVLDHLFAKNNVERIIESVVNEAFIRTNQDSCSAKITAENNGKTTTNESVLNKKSTNNKSVLTKKSESKKVVGASRRKSKCKELAIPQVITKIPRRSLHLPRWSNGWIWEGDPYEAKVFINSDETMVIRKCYPTMRHEEGDKIVPRDCVLLKAGPRKNDLPFVAKIASLWENPDDGEMMMSLLWYYRPEHTEQGRLSTDQPDEVFASRHKDSNSVACIDDKCFVLTFNEYCRYRKRCRMIEAGIEEPLPCIPNPEPYPRSHRQPPLSQISPEMVFFCRRVYDFRQKRKMKNPT